MQPDQIAGLLTATGLVIGALATLIGSIAAVVKAARAPKGDSPAPQLGLTATASPADDIDIRAWEDLRDRLNRAEEDRDRWMRRALGIDEDTHPT